jgi:two-component system CheB/CheR fusion protein
MTYTFKVIAFGISAGGMPPLKKILSMLPDDLHAAIVIIPHLYPHYRSRLDQILTREIARPVLRISTGMYIQPGNIYALPEGQVLSIHNGRFQLSPRSEDEKINKAIDHFFISLAEDAGDQSIGIILSGAGYDGIQGAKAIEDEKGIIIVQDPQTAQFPMMPNGLIAYDHPDYVLTPEEIVQKLTYFSVKNDG